MFVGLDGLNTKTTKAILDTDTVLALSDTTVCEKLGVNHSYLTITDGTKSEVVKVTCVSGQVTMVRTQGKNFASNTCVRYQVTTDVVCDLIAQGGCSATASCTPIGKATSSFQSAVVGAQWVGVVVFPNGTGIDVTVKPSWVTQEISAGTVTFKGTPPTISSDVSFVVVGTGCNGSISTFTGSIGICEPVGATDV
jgi:hypothetical protein